MHHKRGKARNARADCKLCQPWKPNGFRTGRPAGETFAASPPFRRHPSGPSCLRPRPERPRPAARPRR